MHQGNLFLDATGRLVAVDFGITGRLGPKERRFLAEILERVMPELGEDYAALEARYDDAQWVSCRLAEVLAMETFERQALLELDDPLDRLQMLVKKVRGDD
jgi:predicted unusual protein kinase regulating ubiquinone biosynthesis (AarF/ABC1/UbiB family)